MHALFLAVVLSAGPGDGGVPDHGLASSDAGAVDSTSGSGVPVVLSHRAGTPEIERFRLANIDKACGAATKHVALPFAGRNYLITCSHDSIHDATNGFLPPELRGYRDVEWGVSKHDVVAMDNDLEQTNGDEMEGLGKQSEFHGVPMTLAYHFDHGRLVGVYFVTVAQPRPGKPLEQHFRAIMSDLERVYGPAVRYTNGRARIGQWNNDSTVVMVVLEPMKSLSVIYSDFHAAQRLPSAMLQSLNANGRP